MYMNFDESGNLGRQGRYFVIAAVEGNDLKPLKNIMKKSVLKVKNTFPEYQHTKELKASDSTPIIKDYMNRKIAAKNFGIRYIVADLLHINPPSLLADQNLLYNYMLHFLILPAVRKHKPDELTLNLDMRTIKVQSENSFEDYIKLKVRYELGIDTKINVNYIESQNSYLIQAADFVANAVYQKYERGNEYFYNLLKPKMVQEELFPRKHFGGKKIIRVLS